MITSRQNPLAQRARAARDGKIDELVFVEGARLCGEAARSELALEEALFTSKFAAAHAALLADLRARARRAEEVSDGVLDSISDTKTPQGVVLLARRPTTDAATFARTFPHDPLVVVLHGINNPSNAGAIVRVAEASGAAGVVTTEGTADLLSPKALRSAMGSAFRLPMWAGARFREVIEWCRAREIETVGTHLGATQSHIEHDWRGARAVICGAEADGLSPDEIGRTDARIRIPMREPVESLNVAVAVAIVLYEAARQRGFAV